METAQIRLFTLLKDDPIYRQYFTKQPKPLRVFHTSDKPWRLIIQKEKEGKWFRADYPSYAQAFHTLKPRLSEWWDAAIHCKPQAFNAPVVKVNGKRIWAPMPEEHVWCVYCRRPTVTIYCHYHHMSKYRLPIEEPRCLMCGARRQAMRKFPSPELWPLHVGNLS